VKMLSNLIHYSLADNVATFFDVHSAEDARYAILRDDDLPIVASARQFVDHMWQRCAEFLDSELPARASRGFLPVFWELYVAYTLWSNGVELVPRKRRLPARQGPDLLARFGHVWIEATLPSAGSGPDAVPEPSGAGVAWYLPDDQMKLRLRSAIEEKHTRFLEYERRGWVKPSQPVVIAVGGAALPIRFAELTIPRIVRSVLPIGHEQVHLSTESLEIIGHSFQYQSTVAKLAGSIVRTDVFLDSTYCGISAVLYSGSDEINRPNTPGVDFVLVRNPNAVAPLPHNWLPFAWEYWVDGELLNRREPTA
jgi:hypothetical protein